MKVNPTQVNYFKNLFRRETDVFSAGLSFVETSACESTNVEVAFEQNLTDVYHIVAKVILFLTAIPLVDHL